VLFRFVLDFQFIQFSSDFEWSTCPLSKGSTITLQRTSPRQCLTHREVSGKKDSEGCVTLFDLLNVHIATGLKRRRESDASHIGVESSLETSHATFAVAATDEGADLPTLLPSSLSASLNSSQTSNPLWANETTTPSNTDAISFKRRRHDVGGGNAALFLNKAHFSRHLSGATVDSSLSLTVPSSSLRASHQHHHHSVSFSSTDIILGEEPTNDPTKLQPPTQQQRPTNLMRFVTPTASGSSSSSLEIPGSDASSIAPPTFKTNRHRSFLARRQQQVKRLELQQQQEHLDRKGSKLASNPFSTTEDEGEGDSEGNDEEREDWDMNVGYAGAIEEEMYEEEYHAANKSNIFDDGITDSELQDFELQQKAFVKGIHGGTNRLQFSSEDEEDFEQYQGSDEDCDVEDDDYDNSQGGAHGSLRLIPTVIDPECHTIVDDIMAIIQGTPPHIEGSTEFKVQR
jgi:hypothetical protein